MIRDLIQHIMEAGRDPFIPASEDEHSKRREEGERKREEEKKARLELIKKKRASKESGTETEDIEVSDVCPHCFSDLREVDVNQNETTYGTIQRYYSNGYWEYGDGDTSESEVGDSFCGECGGEVSQGEDWDA